VAHASVAPIAKDKPIAQTIICARMHPRFGKAVLTQLRVNTLWKPPYRRLIPHNERQRTAKPIERVGAATRHENARKGLGDHCNAVKKTRSPMSTISFPPAADRKSHVIATTNCNQS
jgi:hypothetical protein